MTVMTGTTEHPLPLAPDRSPLAPTGRLRLLPDLGGLPAEVVVEAGPQLLREGAERRAGPYLRLYQPAPTVAFTGMDRLSDGYPAAREAARQHGFTPVLRAPGGRAVAYHEQSLCLEITAGGGRPQAAITARFAALADVFVTVLSGFGLDARIGAVPDEYCPGAYSVNVAGVHKLMGAAQRITRDGWMLGASLVVRNPEPVRAVLRDVYQALNVPFDPASVGDVSTFAPHVRTSDVAAALLRELGRSIALEPCPWPPHIDPDQGPQ